MKIVNIFGHQLFSFVYLSDDGVTYSENEYDRLMDLWSDVNYLRNYGKRNNISNINQFVEDRLRDAENIQDLFEEIIEGIRPLEGYFKPLFNEEYRYKLLSRQKGRVSSKDGLRLYAIKIDEGYFVITGGAIKMSLAMQDHPDTENERIKINTAQHFLKENHVIDIDSFYEFKSELE